MTVLTIALSLILANAASPAPNRITRPRVYIPDDADPCDFERFKADSHLGQWLRELSPNTASAAKCYHTPAKLLPALSRMLNELDHDKLKAEIITKFDLRAAALTGYQVESMIDVTREGRRAVGLIFKSGVNGPVAAQIFGEP